MVCVSRGSTTIDRSTVVDERKIILYDHTNQYTTTHMYQHNGNHHTVHVNIIAYIIIGPRTIYA